MKPCPFCDELPFKRISLKSDNDGNIYRYLICEVGCPKGCATFSVAVSLGQVETTNFSDIEKTFYIIEEKWNTRHYNPLYDI